MIYKYVIGEPCKIGQRKVAISMPKVEVNRILDIQMQGDYAVLWAEVTPANTNAEIIVKGVWTGFREPDDMMYLKTIQEPSTGLVYHYYYMWSDNSYT